MVRSIAVFVLVFVLGAVAGGALVSTWRAAPTPAPAPALAMEHRLAILQRRLELTPDQAGRVRAILAEHQGAFAARLAEVIGADAELRGRRPALIAAIREVLTDAQRARFDGFVDDLPFGPPGVDGLRGPPWRRGGGPPR